MLIRVHTEVSREKRFPGCKKRHKNTFHKLIVNRSFIKPGENHGMLGSFFISNNEILQAKQRHRNTCMTEN